MKSNMRRLKVKYIIIFVITFFCVVYFNPISHLLEKDFYTEFYYPLESDISPLVAQLRRGEKPSTEPINVYNYSFLTSCKEKCRNGNKYIKPKLVYIVKSAMDHFNRRATIRLTWGYEHRFSDVTIRTIFMLGTKDDPELQSQINLESDKFKDIVQADFIDAYYNNTIKTMMAFKWATTFCPHSQFYVFIDDDMYVSTKNMLKFVRNPVYYPGYLKRPHEALRQLARQEREVNNVTIDNVSTNASTDSSVDEFIRTKRQIIDFELPADARLFTGFVFFNSSPFRSRGSKWYVPLKEYPWHKWPPYVAAGAFVLSKEALLNMYYTSLYTKHFRFDDIFLGLVALKAGIEPLHNEEFHFYHAHFSTPHNYRYVLTSHGYDNPHELQRVWNEAKAAGHA